MMRSDLPRFLRTVTRGATKLLIFAVVAQTVALVVLALQLILIRNVVDSVAERANPTGWIVGLVALVLAQRVAGSASSSLTAMLRDHARASAEGKLMDLLQRSDPSALLVREFYERLHNAKEAAATHAGEVVYSAIVLIGSVIGLAGLVAVLSQISPGVAILIMLAMIPWILGERSGFAHVKLARESTSDRRQLRDYLADLLLVPNSSTEAVVSSGAAGGILRLYNSESRNVTRSERKAFLSQMGRGTLGNVVGAALVGTAFVLALTSYTGPESVGRVAATIAALTAFVAVTANLANSLSGVLRHGGHIQAYMSFVDASPTEAPTEELSPVCNRDRTEHPTASLGLQVQGASYSYVGAEGFSVSSLNLRVDPGELVAIVGTNGSGKSTLLRLILGIVPCTAGHIEFAGNDVSTDRRRHRLNASFMLQDPPRYELSIRESSRLEGGSVSDLELTEALRCVGMLDLVDAIGLDSPVGHLRRSARPLSGGQWQRLAIARAISKHSDLLVLDEPTAALDPKAEIAVVELLRRIVAERNVCGVVVSHRWACVAGADRVVVMSDGKIVETGTHGELVQLGGVYAANFDLQQEALLRMAQQDDGPAVRSEQGK